MKQIFTRAVTATTIAAIGFSLAGCTQVAHAAATPTMLVQKDGKWLLMRDGKPYFIKGAGGDGSKEMLRAAGGNSFRTWGSDNLGAQLDAAQKLGLSVTVGIWLGHIEHSFDYSDPKQVADQFDRAKAAIDKYKDHPAVLMWGIGNEMEGYGATTDPKMWKAVEDIAAYAHKVDPNHPTMTVVAEIGGDKVASINKYCPDIDVVGLNSYGGGPSIGERYAKAGGVKPFALTEYGPPGTWEMGRNSWGVVPEPSSTDKANFYRSTYEKTLNASPFSIGGYAFTWGNKQEATATWFGLLLNDGTKLGAVDELTDLWSGKYPANRSPEIKKLALEGKDKIAPGTTIKVDLNVVDPDKDPLKVKWILQHDPAVDSVGGETQATPPTYPEAIVAQSNEGVTVKMPKFGGAYRLFAYVYDGKNNGAVANIPLFVEGGVEAPPPGARKVSLPFSIYDDAGDAPYTASGYMGDVANLKMTADDTSNPHGGTTAIKAQYTSGQGWGGVVWQSPANDWGDLPGGYDVSGATKLSFWARGEKGGENVSFSFGLLDKAKFSDSGKGELNDVALTKDWKQYSIDVSNQDLSRVKTGFAWIVGAKGEPVTFYLDDIKFEAEAGKKAFVPVAKVEPVPVAAGAKVTPVAAVGNASLPAMGGKATLPLAVYSDAGDKLPYIPAGYMGEAGNIKMADDDTSNPHSGKTSIKAQYTSGNGWGGVVWQSPANDWGDKPGGYDLTGAKKLTFWARGENGGEKVSFSFGLLDKAKYADSAKGELKDVELSKEWKQYSIDLAGKDLKQIKTGFVWIVGAKGEPVTFYLDDIKFE